MSEQNNQTHPEHLGYLDSVRGIAASMVVLYHYINWRYEDRLFAKVSSIVFNGADAVSFFFVLSGFVLSYKYIVLNKPLDIKKFYIGRFLRLWPAYFVTLLVLYFILYWTPWSVSQLIDTFILNKGAFWEEAALIRPVAKIYGPGWTLVIELVLSLFIPFHIILAQKSRKVIWWLLAYFYIIGNSFGAWSMFHNHFVYGMILSCYFGFILSKDFEKTIWYRYRVIWLSIAAVLFSYHHIARIWPPGPTYEYIFEQYLGYDFFHMSGFASFVFLVFIVHSTKAKRFLELRPLKYIGKISYSIYLTHWIAVNYTFNNWDKLMKYFPDERSGFIVLFIICIIATFCMAAVLYHFVELPCIRYAKRWVSKLKPSYIITSDKKV